MRKNNIFNRALEVFSTKATVWSGKSFVFIIAFLFIIVWGITGPFFHFSDTWQLVINTGTGIITFLMVFLIQRAQNKESLALQLKLNEIIAALAGASNRLIDIQDLSESELETLHQYYGKLAEMSKQDYKLTESHSIEEAKNHHQLKQKNI